MCLNLMWHVPIHSYVIITTSGHVQNESLLLLEFGTWFVVDTRVFSCVNYTVEVKKVNAYCDPIPFVGICLPIGRRFASPKLRHRF